MIRDFQTPPEALNKYHSFSDETCVTAHRYMVIGGVLCTRDFAQKIWEEVDRSHPTRPDHWAYEWKSIRKANLDRFKEFCDIFIKYNRTNHIDFRCVVINCQELDHSSFNEGDGDLGFNKFLYQHLYSHFRHYGDASSFYCYHDRRVSVWSLDDIKQCLNNKTASLCIDPRRRYPLLQYADKRDVPMLQFADVLLGAVGFAWNDKAANHHKSPKHELSEHIRAGVMLPTLAEKTPYHKRHFDIWPLKLAPRKPSSA